MRFVRLRSPLRDRYLRLLLLPLTIAFVFNLPQTMLQHTIFMHEISVDSLSRSQLTLQLLDLVSQLFFLQIPHTLLQSDLLVLGLDGRFLTYKN